MFEKKKHIVEEYRGNEAQARKLFLKDAEKQAAKGYYPTSENFTQGTYGCGSFIFALLLCFVIVGIFIFIYMILVKPPGTLTVTYEFREVAQEKQCPQCAETVKAAATVCRFCSYEFR
ncbi:zinc ribbon domain-containing protein [Paucibacter sp. TC2R-5]|uniref:zinc ribbon domain-containing protein n=1 Tax=Paucibacter sp. TC2R-5 TaxID=2893555 RepID=UPI0021E36A15|nr:zinc ribbon domain-containing protein [Paucibacter sp. TC2R-5]MCV2361435.1 zinc ribbon domain-containing protein [Paucibacter sp. TC2R-5]